LKLKIGFFEPQITRVLSKNLPAVLLNVTAIMAAGKGESNVVNRNIEGGEASRIASAALVFKGI
jgi:hypothetical protein